MGGRERVLSRIKRECVCSESPPGESCHPQTSKNQYTLWMTTALVGSYLRRAKPEPGNHTLPPYSTIWHPWKVDVKTSDREATETPPDRRTLPTITGLLRGWGGGAQGHRADQIPLGVWPDLLSSALSQDPLNGEAWTLLPAVKSRDHTQIPLD